jgi:hypothetical protein
MSVFLIDGSQIMDMDVVSRRSLLLILRQYDADSQFPNGQPASGISTILCNAHGLELRALMALTPGTKLGPYEIVPPVGTGGMGVVYRARDTRIGFAIPSSRAAQPTEAIL